MKKIAGIIALTTVLCAFTGCGNTKDDRASETLSETTSAVQDTTAAETTEAVTEAAYYSSYEELVKDFVEAYAANDRKKTLFMQYPDSCADIIKVTMKGDNAGEDDGISIGGDISEEEAITSLQYKLYEDYREDEKVTFLGIVSAEELWRSEADTITQNWGVMKGLERSIKEHGGPDNMNRFELDEIESDLMGEDHTGDFEFIEGYHVTFEIKDDSTGEVSQGMMNVFKMKGESWKVSVLDADGNVIRDRHSSSDAVLSSLNRALNTVLVELDEENNFAVTQSEIPFIVGSDDSFSINIPESLDTSYFRQRTGLYMSGISELEWFAVIYKGAVVYCAVDNADRTGVVGTYPPNVVFNSIDESGSAVYGENPEQKTLNELYDVCAEAVGK